jgi:hypothetical protein
MVDLSHYLNYGLVEAKCASGKIQIKNQWIVVKTKTLRMVFCLIGFLENETNDKYYGNPDI